jgi:5-formyltetrahydrofolate cyclo-ligase
MSAPSEDPAAAELAFLRQRAKAEIRRQIRAVRKLLPPAACAERAARACAQAAAVAELSGARTLIAYVAMRKELDPHALCEQAWQRGARVGLPRIAEQGLELHAHTSDAALVENELGVREPAAACARIALSEVDVILVPALAVDPRGYRVGYGGGYYDRLLVTLPNALKIALVYDFQVVAEAPNEAHDAPVDWIVSDARIIRAER